MAKYGLPYREVASPMDLIKKKPLPKPYNQYLQIIPLL
jgi:hypothetical protein